MRERVIVALDYRSRQGAEELIAALSGLISYYKVGLELYTAEGPGIIRVLKEKGLQIFLDLKIFDIPSTMSRTARVITSLGVDMFNLHLLAGKEALLAVREAVEDEAGRKRLSLPKILGVTILTSSADTEWQEIGFAGDVSKMVLSLGQRAKETGLSGVVASAQDARSLKDAFGKDFLVVSPGIRLHGENTAQPDDQKRTLSAKEAFAAGCDYIVVGRPITRALDPRKTCQELLQTLDYGNNQS